MKLYMVPAAPNPTKVMLYIAEREAAGSMLPVEQIVVNTLKGRHQNPNTWRVIHSERYRCWNYLMVAICSNPCRSFAF